MIDMRPISLFLADDAATSRLGALLSTRLRSGNTVLLHGPIGAGKTHLARALIQARLGRAEDVPSPSFTLVQTYGAAGDEIWHADLYRLTHPDDVLELGLEDVFATAICLIEWPDRLGKRIPANALHITLSDEGQGRRAVLAGQTHAALLQDLATHWQNDD
jgi:tRNA threonylcarbamoyladenosine biosynthesis protein TsaE